MTRLAPSRLSLGCAPLGNLYRATDDAEAQATVDAAWDRGVRWFDTAPLYGHGRSEERTGAALRERPRQEFVLATKVGRLLVDDPGRESAVGAIFEDLPSRKPVFDFSRDGVRRALDASLERLGLDRVDVLHVHDPDDHVEQALTEALPALVELRDEGVVGAIGLGTNRVDVADRFVGIVDLDWLLLAGRLTLLEPVGALDLLDRCVEHHVDVLAAGVFNSGILADPRSRPFYDYAPAPADIRARVAQLEQRCARYDVPLAAAALQLPLRHPAVRTVLVGAGTPAEVHEDADLLEHPVPADLWTELRDLATPA